MGSWTRRAGISATLYAARPSVVGTIRARSGTIATRVRLVYGARSKRWYATVGGPFSSLPFRVAHASIADIPAIDLYFHAVIPRPSMRATRIQLRVRPASFSPRSNVLVGRRRLGTSSVHWRGRRSRAERCAGSEYLARFYFCNLPHIPSRLLSCGFHHCDRLCHSDGCGTCHAVCGKSRKLW